MRQIVSPRMCRLRSLVALCAISTLVAAACGSGSDDSPDAVAPVVKIGVLVPIEDGLTEFGRGIANSVQLAADQANERDAIPGWTIVVEPVDDSSDPDTGAEGARALVDDPEVLGVVGTYNSGVAQAALPIFAEADLTMISPGNTLASLSRGTDPAAPQRPFENYFRMIATDEEQGPFLAARAYDELGARRVAVVSETKEVSAGLADLFAAEFASLGGEVVLRSTVPDGTDDLTEFVVDAGAEAPDLVFVGGEYPVAIALRNQMSAADLEAPLMGGDGMKDDAYFEETGEASVGDLASTVGAPTDTIPTAAQFLADYDAADFDDAASDFGVYAYDATNVLIDALAEVLDGTDTIPDDARARVIPLVAATETAGASGPLAFDEFGDTAHPVLTLFTVEQTDADLRWAVVVTTGT